MYPLLVTDMTILMPHPELLLSKYNIKIINLKNCQALVKKSHDIPGRVLTIILELNFRTFKDI